MLQNRRHSGKKHCSEGVTETLQGRPARLTACPVVLVELPKVLRGPQRVWRCFCWLAGGGGGAGESHSIDFTPPKYIEILIYFARRRYGKRYTDIQVGHRVFVGTDFLNLFVGTPAYLFGCGSSSSCQRRRQGSSPPRIELKPGLSRNRSR